MDKQTRAEFNEIWKLNFNLRALILELQQTNIDQELVLRRLIERTGD